MKRGWEGLTEWAVMGQGRARILFSGHQGAAGQPGQGTGTLCLKPALAAAERRAEGRVMMPWAELEVWGRMALGTRGRSRPLHPQQQQQRLLLFPYC